MKSSIIEFAIVLLLTANGFCAIFNAVSKNKKQEKIAKRNAFLSQNRILDLGDEFTAIESCGVSLCFPKTIIENGGFTGRGNPSLSRCRFGLMSNIEKRIERIVR